MLSILSLLLCSHIVTAYRVKYGPVFRLFNQRKFTTTLKSVSDEDAGNSFDGQDLNEALKSMGPVWGSAAGQPDNDVFEELKKDQAARAEEIYREYPFAEVELPLLPDCNNYYSGQFGDFFWHQNTDQVYVYLPVDDDLKRKEVDVKFEAKSVSVKVRGEELIFFECLERIIPDGSFWTFETDKNNKRYLHLDLEKRFRMINWKGLFGEAQEEDTTVVENRSKMLEKLFAANKGMSKISGMPPESMEELMKNGELTKMLADQIYPDPEASAVLEDGSETPYELVEESEMTPDDVSAGDVEYSDRRLNAQDMDIIEGEIVEPEPSNDD